MKIVNVDLGDISHANIYIFSDMHIGSKKFDKELVAEQINKCKDDPNGVAILLGDLINNSTKDSVGDTYSETLPPMDQINGAIRIFEPIQDKIIGITTGNHERRSYKKDGIDLMQILAMQFKKDESCYDPTACCLYISIGRGNRGNRPNVYSLYMTHGDGNGGATIGGKANGLSKRGKIIDADIVVAGHTHTPLTFRESRFQCDKIHRAVYRREQVFVNAASTLQYEDYAELYGMAPSSTRMPVIRISGRGSRVEVTV